MAHYFRSLAVIHLIEIFGSEKLFFFLFITLLRLRIELFFSALLLREELLVSAVHLRVSHRLSLLELGGR